MTGLARGWYMKTIRSSLYVHLMSPFGYVGCPKENAKDKMIKYSVPISVILILIFQIGTFAVVVLCFKAYRLSRLVAQQNLDLGKQLVELELACKDYENLTGLLLANPNFLDNLENPYSYLADEEHSSDEEKEKQNLGDAVKEKEKKSEAVLFFNNLRNIENIKNCMKEATKFIKSKGLKDGSKESIAFYLSVVINTLEVELNPARVPQSTENDSNRPPILDKCMEDCEKYFREALLSIVEDYFDLIDLIFKTTYNASDDPEPVVNQEEKTVTEVLSAKNVATIRSFVSSVVTATPREPNFKITSRDIVMFFYILQRYNCYFDVFGTHGIMKKKPDCNLPVSQLDVVALKDHVSIYQLTVKTPEEVDKLIAAQTNKTINNLGKTSTLRPNFGGKK